VKRLRRVPIARAASRCPAGVPIEVVDELARASTTVDGSGMDVWSRMFRCVAAGEQ
jgi:hypothetical protein